MRTPRDDPPYTLLDKYIRGNAESPTMSPHRLPTTCKGKEVRVEKSVRMWINKRTDDINAVDR
jgi:hypothetical protein